VVVVTETRSGQILALADYPSYDANNPTDVKHKGDLGARALSDVYEPGSVAKALTFAALIEEGEISPRTRLKVPGSIERAGARPVGDYWDHGTLRLTAAGALAKSSNVGTVMAARELDKGTFRDYLTRFGLGARTDIGVRGESPGILPDNWSDGTRD